MKSSQVKTVICVMALIVGVSLRCSQEEFLTRTPTGALTTDLLNDEQAIESMIVGTYAALDGRVPGGGWASGCSNWVWGGIRSDNAHRGSELDDQPEFTPIERNTLTPLNSFLSQKWGASYEGVARSNNTLLALERIRSQGALNEDLLLTFEAESRFLRAFYHFEVKKVFNQVPYVTVNQDQFTNQIDIWPQLEADLQFAMEYLPFTKANVGRTDHWVAMAYLAKAHMYQADFVAAKPLLDEIILSGPYQLVADFQMNFNIATQNNVEVIFSVQSSVNDGSPYDDNGNQDALNGTFGTGIPIQCCGFYQPSQNLVNAFQTDEEGLPFLAGFNEPGIQSDMGIPPSLLTWQEALQRHQQEGFVPNSTLVIRSDPAAPHIERIYLATTDAPLGDDPLSSHETYHLIWEEPQNNLDPRLDRTVGRRGIPFNGFGDHPGAAWIRDQSWSGPYSPRKNLWNAEDDPNLVSSGWIQTISALNTNLMRYAEILLWRAEVAVEEGDLTYAMELVNQIRRRARDSRPVMERDNITPAANYLIEEYPTNHPAFFDPNVTREAVRFETRLELAMEGHRFFDLVRWGIAAEVMNEYLVVERERLSQLLGSAHFIEGTHEYMPIPQTEIDAAAADENIELEQNPGYF